MQLGVKSRVSQKTPPLETSPALSLQLPNTCFLFQLSETETKMKAFEEECGTLRDDIANTHLAKDELIKKAWEVRDAAVKRKNNTEIELARSRIDVMQVITAMAWMLGSVIEN